MAYQIQDPFRHYPVIGEIIPKLGMIEWIASQPCSVEPVLVVKAAFQALPIMFWSLFCPEPLDLAFDRIRPGVRGLSPHQRRRRMRMRNAFGLPADVVDTGAKLAWFRLGQFAQRIGWYLIVADATTDFLVNWTSLSYQYSGCLAGQKTGAQHIPSLPLANERTGDWGGKLWDPVYDPNGMESGGNWTIDSRQYWDVSIKTKAAWNPILGDDQDWLYNWRVVDWPSGDVIATMGLRTMPAHGSTSSAGHVSIPPNGDPSRLVRVQQFGQGTAVDITGTEVLFFQSDVRAVDLLESSCW